MFTKGLMSRQNIRARLLPAIALMFWASSLVMYAVPSDVAQAAGTITGTAYRDYDENGLRGTREPGQAGITVTAYDDTNSVVGTATTAANGTYTLTFTGAATRVRLEFTGLPTGVQPGAFGTQSGTTVQFANAGATNVNVGVNRPSDYCQAVPNLAACILDYAASTGNVSASVGVFPYTAGLPANANVFTPNATVQSRVNQIGSVFGMAYQRVSNSLFVASFQKRHSGYGPTDSTGTIYRIDRNGTLPNAATFLDLNTLFPGSTGVNPHPNASADFFRDIPSFDQVGKIALGGMSMDEENDILYVMNLANKELYKIPIGQTATAPAAAAITHVPTPANPPSCTGVAGDVRPFAVKVHENLVYVGMVCTAQSTTTTTGALPFPNGNANLLRAYIYTFDPATNTFSAAPVFQIPLNYTRRCANDATVGTCATDPKFSADWQPWTSVFDVQHHKPAGGEVGVYPQPMLTDIAFDGDNLVLALRDRYGDMQGNHVARPDPTDNTLYSAVAGGDVLRACGTVSTGWTLETNGTCGGVTTGGANNAQGPTNGEYYYQEDFQPFHEEISLGGLAMVPGFPDIVSTVYDPDRANTTGDATYDGGIRTYFNDNSTAANTAGTTNRQYRLYNGDGGDSNTFGKSNGMAEVQEICNAAPIEIGNRVWNDTNANGIQDPTELPIQNVTVTLFQGATQVGTTTTDVNGQYLFTAANVTGGVLPNTTYQVRVATGQAALTGLLLTQNDVNSGANFDVRDSDGVTAGTDAVINVTTGRAGANDHTLDFGFAPSVSLGNLVWNDANNNGLFDAGEVAVAGVTVNLYRDSNTNGICEVATDTLAGTTVTTATTADPTGNYLFTNLASGSYCVVLAASNFTTGNPLFGYTSSSGTPNSSTGPYEPAPAASPNDDVNNNDDGTFTAGQGIASKVVTLQSSTEPTTDGDASTNSNLTLDFGVFAGAALGDFVWNDLDRDGVQDAGEPGVAGVTATLRDAGTNAQVGTPLVTNAAGNYLFTNLNPGTYYVVFSTLPAGFVFSPRDAGGNDTLDSDADTTTGQTGSYTLVNNQTDLTVDAGINQPAATLSLGNLVWNDLNNNGLYDAATETAIGGVTVTLFQDTNTNGICEPGIDTQVGANATTTANAADPTGNYLFTGLAAGSYCVVLPASNFTGAGVLAGYNSSTGTNGSATGPYEPAPAASPNNDINNNDDGSFVAAVGIRSNVITLSAAGEPVNDGDSDSNTNLSLDFGVFRPASLGDFVWNDTNRNGIQDAGEPGVAGVTATLFDNTNAQVGTSLLTNPAGNYLFTNLTPGTYYVVFSTLPATFVFSPQDAGGNDALDSDASTTTGRTGNYTLAAGDNNITVDAGINVPVAPTLSLGNLVWNDLNNNGLFDAATETAIAGVTVNLYRDSNANNVCEPGTDTQVGASLTTSGSAADPAGNYLFTNLTAGAYCVHLPESNFGAGGALNGYNSSTGTNGSATGAYEPAPAASPDDNVNNNDDGTRVVANGIRSNIVNLALNTEPVNDGDADANTNLTVDFGVFRPASLGDFVWNDTNRNGVQDAGEPGVAGVTATLFQQGNPTALGSQATNPAGNYLFTNLTPGTYYVVFSTLPAGFVFSPQDAGADDALDSDANTTTGQTGNYTLAAGDNNLTVDAGINQPAAVTLSLGNLVWNDLNNNGLFDAATETAIAGVTVNLYRDSNANGVCEPGTDTQVGASQTTTGNAADPAGNYLFVGLPAGAYCAHLPESNFTAPGVLAGYNSSTGTNANAAGPFEPAGNPDNNTNNNDDGTRATGNGILSGIINLAVGAEPTTDGDTDANTNLTLDFGVFRPASLGDFVWNDTNRNGIQDAGEPGVAGVTATLFQQGNATALGSQTTNPAGNYLFTNLSAGTYYVVFSTLPTGFVFSPADQGANDALDSDTNVTTGQTGNYTLAAGDNNLTVDAGINQPVTPLASLGNFVWLDNDRDGIQDTNEPGVSGVTVVLFDGAGAQLATTTTDANGNYLFSSLQPGTYSVGFTVPAIYTLTLQTQGTDQAVDSNPDRTTGRAAPVTLAAGDNNLTIDAGVYQLSGLGDFVWADNNSNGIQDAGEPGIPGVVVNLYDQAGNVIATTTTNQAGNYLFSGLPAGTYSVGFVIPAGYTVSPQTQGTDNTVDSNPDRTTGRTALITLAAGELNLTIDAGLFQNVSLGNLVWNDVNNNGLVDAGEAGIAGVTVNVYRDTNSNGTFEAGTDTLAGTVTTNPSGNYLFANLAPGTYLVQVADANFATGGALAGFTTSTGTNGSLTGPYEPAGSPNNDVDNNDDGSALTGQGLVSRGITLQPGAEPVNDGDTDANSNLTVDFGVFQPASLGDFVWNDGNNNGVQDQGEPGVPGVVATIYATGSTTPIGTITIGPDGNYLFTNLIPGSYYVVFSNLPTNLTFTGQDQGGNDATDSDANPISGRTGDVALTPGQSNRTVDAGLIQPNAALASLGDFVWNDTNRNGIQDAGELGVAGVQVTLYDASGNVIATTNTDANGRYNFVNLQPGSYSVGFALPSGYNFSPQTQGGNTAVDSNPDQNTGRTGSITLAAGENNLTIDAGVNQPNVTTPTPVPSTPVPSTPVPTTPTPTLEPGQPTPTPTLNPGQPTPTPTPTLEPGQPTPTPVDTSEPFITKEVDVTKAGVGQTVKFTITVNNQTSTEANEIVVMDNVPASFVVQGATSSQGKVTVTGQNVTVEIGTVPAGGKATIVVTTIVAAGATGDVTNRVNMVGKMVGGRSFGGMGAGGSANTTSTASVSISIPGVPNTGMANVGYDFNWLMLVVAMVMMLVGGRLLWTSRKTNRQQ